MATVDAGSVQTTSGRGREWEIWKGRALLYLLRLWEIFRKLLRSRVGFTGLFIVVGFILLAVAAPFFAGPHPSSREAFRDTPLLAPSLTHFLGTDWQGRDLFALVVYGSQVSLIVGLAASFVSIVVGTAVGLVGGYYGRIVDQVLARATDFFLVIPWLPFVIVIAAILGPGFWTTVIAIAVVSWPSTARIVRSQVLSIKTRPFITRARAIGANDLHILRSHVVPVIAPLVFANAVLTVSVAIFTESFLSFFGLGDPTTVSWGKIIQEAYDHQVAFGGMWWYFGPPGVSVSVLVLGFSMVSYALEEILNPRLRKR